MRGFNNKTNRVSHIIITGTTPNSSTAADHLTKELGIEPNKVVSSTKSSPTKLYRWWLLILLLVLCYVGGFLITLSVTFIPETHPNPTTTVDSNEFSVDNAYSHLEIITRQPHHFNMPYNEQVYSYIKRFAGQLQTQYDEVELDTEDRDITFITGSTNSSQFGLGNSTGYFEASNVVVRVKGTRSQNSLLISAHFDSVPLSYGANDNGMGVATSLEILRLLAIDPPPNDVIFNFNNHEEAGLLGSYSFTKHPWFPNVKAFINIDGAGAGGRVLLFQCSSPELVNLAKAIPHPNTSVLGNDLFQLRVLNSITDFAIYSTSQRIPGVDFAIYKNRAFYHTVMDDFNHAYLPTLANMGQSIWPLTQAILASSYLNSNPKIQVAGIFYDLLGLSSINYQFTSDLVLGITLNLLMIVAAVSYYGYLRLTRPTLLPPTWRVILGPTARGFLVIILGILLYVGLSHVFNFIIQKVNLLIVHDQWILVYFFNSGLALMCFMLVDYFWLQFELRYGSNLIATNQQHYRRFQVILISMGYLWFLGLILQRVMTSMFIGIFYYVTWFSGAYLITYFIFIILDPINYWLLTQLPDQPYNLIQFTLLMVCLVLIPGLILQDAAKNVLISMSQSLVTGTSPYFVYLLVSFFSMATTLPMFPFLTLTSNHYRKSIPGLLMILIMLFITIITMNPLHIGAPTTIYATQTYNLSDGNNQVTLRGVSQLDKLSQQLSIKQLSINNKLTLTPGTPFDMIQFNGKLPTFPVSNTHLINITQVNSTETSKLFQFQAFDTKQCRLRFPIDLSITNLSITTNSNWLNLSTDISPPPNLKSTPSTNNEFYTIYLFRRLSKTPWSLQFHHPPTSQPINLQVTCFYDDYPQYIPTITDLLSKLPNHITLSTSAHILEVYQTLSL